MNATILGGAMLVGGFYAMSEGKWLGGLILMILGFFLASNNDPARNKD